MVPRSWSTTLVATYACEHERATWPGASLACLAVVTQLHALWATAPHSAAVAERPFCWLRAGLPVGLGVQEAPWASREAERGERDARRALDAEVREGEHAGRLRPPCLVASDVGKQAEVRAPRLRGILLCGHLFLGLATILATDRVVGNGNVRVALGAGDVCECSCLVDD